MEELRGRRSCREGGGAGEHRKPQAARQTLPRVNVVSYWRLALAACIFDLITLLLEEVVERSKLINFGDAHVHAKLIFGFLGLDIVKVRH